MITSIILPLLGIVGFVWLAYTWWRDVNELDQEAETAYVRFHQSGESETEGLGALNKEDFIDLYKRANRVRRQKYILLFLLLGLISLAPSLAIGALVQNTMSFGPLVSQFIIFFLVIFGWIGAVAITLRFYHTRRPGTVQAEYEKQFGG